MENRRGNEIFLGVVGVATLLVAIIGATFAYFSASAQSGNEAVKVVSTELSLGYAEDPTNLSTDLIPAAQAYALYAGTNEQWLSGQEYTYKGSDGKTHTAKGTGLCKDDNSNEICGIYEFTIGNPNFTTAMNIEGSVTSTKNEFQNIWFAVYDETNKQVVVPTKFPETGQTVPLTGLEQQLVGSSKDVQEDGTAKEGFDAKDPTTYTPVVDKSNVANANVSSNRRTYKMVIWIEELVIDGVHQDQTKVDSGKTLAAAIKFQTESGAGVTGVIAAADAVTTPAE